MKAVLVGLFLVGASLDAQWPEVRFEPWLTGLSSPVHLTHAGDGTGRIFVVEQAGVIRVVENGAVSPNVVLDIRERVRFGGEMGLLSVVFPSNFTQKRYFYVNYVNVSTQTIVSRFRLREGSNDADPASEQVLLRIPQPYENHNGGQLAFSPRDGYLYIGMGDGGAGGDPQKNAQNPASLLGKILRIDTESGATPYAVPESNPFRSSSRPEIWTTGWRNPWRFSFDRSNGDMYIGDVGQNLYEEISFQPGASRGGENYGWSLMEGAHCFDDANCLARADLVKPIFEYSRDQGCSITGGHIYRGSRFTAVQGIYIFGDYCSGNIWGLRRAGDAWQSTKFGTTGLQITSFGEDEAGEIYAVDHRGAIQRLASTGVTPQTPAIVSAASFREGLTPGGIGSIFVSSLPGVSGTVAALGYPLPTSLSGVSVTIGGTAVPLYSVSATAQGGQINFFAPYELAGTQASIVVGVFGGNAGPVTMNVSRLVPALFTTPDGFAAALDQNGQPTTRATRGGIVSLFATGLGDVLNRPASGAAAATNPLATTRSAIQVSIGGRQTEVLYSGLAPGYAGLYQINVRLAADTSTGNQDVVITADTIASPPVRLTIE